MTLKPIEIRLSDAENLINKITWTPHITNQRHGADIAKLYEVEEKTIALVRFHPGASAQPHIHDGFETIYVISGAYSDDSGTHTAGDLVIYPDQSIHGWSSESGALLYVVWGGKTSIVK